MKISTSLQIAFLAPFAFVMGCTSSVSRTTASDERLYRNELQSFTSDGCSSFPDGIPYFNATKWQKCCVIHDVSYWQGGTAEQKLEADQNLRSCVAATGERAIAEAMYLGVRAGGYEGLPFTWHWGYGWKISRGYRALSEEEKAQVETLKAQIPQNLAAVPFVSPGAIAIRPSVTGDYCLDAAVDQIQITFNHGFHIVDKKESSSETADGWIKNFSVLTDGCAAPFEFSFLQLKRNSCTSPSNEFAARGRVRLMGIKIPPECVKSTL